MISEDNSKQAFLTATTLTSAHGAGITAPAGTRFILTQRLTKCQANLMLYHSWPLDYCTGVGAFRGIWG